MRTYNRTDKFDIEIGMAVFDADGQNVGTVSRIAGFGSAQVGGGARTDASVTQANSGTGNFDVDRRSLPNASSQPLCLGFNVIDKIVKDHGVILTASTAALEAARRPDSPVTVAKPAKSRGLRFWRHESR